MIIPLIERWRELNQLDKTYFSVLPQLAERDPESRIHTTFLQAAATTGRLASTDPNMQNVPIRTDLGREVRGCFEAAPGNVLLSADYSQIELRVLAHIADEPVLKEIFVRGEDVHTATASKVFNTPPEQLDLGQRSKAKMVNYGIVYGLSDYGLADRLGIPREEAKEIIDTYLARFPAVRAFIEQTIAQATTDGHVTTLWGRRRQIPELKARNWQVRTLGERLAVNTVIQGTAADVMKLAIVRVAAALGDSPRATDPDRPRRAAVRGSGGRRHPCPGDDPPRDVRGLGARPAARRRHRHRPDLDGGQMTREAAVLLTAITGGLVALQAPINSGLGRAVGTWQAACLSFAIGTVALAAIAALAKGGLGQLAEVRHVGWVYLTGGLLGAAYITSVLVTVRSLGLSGVIAATIAGQLAISVVVDQLGLLGVERQPMTVEKVAGVRCWRRAPTSSCASSARRAGRPQASRARCRCGPQKGIDTWRADNTTAGPRRMCGGCSGARGSARRRRRCATGPSAARPRRSTGSCAAAPVRRGRGSPSRRSTASRWIRSTSTDTTSCGGWTRWSAARGR